MKNFLITTCSLFISVIFFISCQKEVNDYPKIGTSEDDAASVNTASKEGENSCRLVQLDWSTGGAGIWQFHYDDKGLADKWTIDYGYGIIDETIFYDESNRLIRADEVFFGSNYVYHFFYTGKRLTRLSRSSIDFPDQVMDFVFTYNSKGQIVRQDDDKSDIHVLMNYDAMGNCTKTDVYFGNDLYYSDNYTFDIPVRNPMLNVPGIEIGFLAYGGTYVTNKRWFTSNRTIIYDTDGTPLVFNDYDPSKTIVKTGGHNFPISADYYDNITGSTISIPFSYENCGGSSDKQDHRYSNGSKNIVTNKTAPLTRPLLFKGSAKSIKERLNQIRLQLKSIKNSSVNN